MTKLFGLVLLLIKVSSSYGGCNNGNAPPLSPRRHYTNLIVGGGPSGLYTAWRLSSRQSKKESTAIFEWSPIRLGGRVFTKTLPGGQILELGAMRFMTQHLLLQQVLRELNLTNQVTDFPMTKNRLFYVRGLHIYQKEVSKRGMPYNTIYRREDPDNLFDEVAKKFHPSNETSRAEWCTFFDEGSFPANVTSNAFRKNDILGNIGYWNLLVDQLGDEGYSYAADTGGFTSNVVNSNAAYSIYSNGDFMTSSQYLHLKTGFSKLIQVLEEDCVKNHVRIFTGQRLTEFYWNAKERKFYSTFMSYNKNGKSIKKTLQVTSDRLFLCMPRRSLELIRETDVVGEWPSNKERRVLKHAPGQFYINSVIKEPAYKVGLTYNHPWWLNATYKPCLSDPLDTGKNGTAYMYNYGPTITDLPLRMIYYFSNYQKMSKEKPVYGIIATYSDMRYTYFWRELELSPYESLWPEHPSVLLQPLFPGTEVTDTMQRVLREQLNRVHYGHSTHLQVPPAIKGYFMNWGRDPYGAGYHTWKAHYKIAEAQYYMTRPSEAINVEVPVYVAGEAYSYDQSWIEGAFTTAETVLVDKIGLNPLLKSLDKYPLICRPKFLGKK